MVSLLSRQSPVTRARSRSINRLANPRAIISANIQNGFGGNKEDETCSLLSINTSDNYQEK